MMNLSCLYYYEKKAYVFNPDTKKSEPQLRPDGSHVANGNYVSFLQVISTYWECVDASQEKWQLNIFLNGGSVSIDRQTGQRIQKFGYTVVLPESQGKKFMERFIAWSEAFGIMAISTGRPAQLSNTDRTPTQRSSRAAVREDDFIDPDTENSDLPVVE
jgi:hypothetical protein